MANVINQVGIYGVNYSSINVPGSRHTHTSILYLDTMIIFGGEGFDISGDFGKLNEQFT